MRSMGHSPPSSNAIWSGRKRFVVSCLVLLHLAAVFVPPFAFATRGPETASPLASHLRDWLRPYFEPMFLDHGYAFFAPEPGPSHLLRCRLEFGQQQPAVELIFPDRTKQWPRLLYHRHFMLAEQLHALYVPPSPPPTQEPGLLSQWREARAQYERRRDSFADHLRHLYGAQHVEIVRVEHRTLSPEQRAAGMKLTDRSLYEDLPETMEDELQLPLSRPEELP